MKRESLVQYVLKPILRRSGITEKRLGLYAFRHGLATELADASVPLPLLQQLRHADVRITPRIYTRVIPESQRQAMEKIGRNQYISGRLAETNSLYLKAKWCLGWESRVESKG